MLIICMIVIVSFCLFVGFQNNHHNITVAVIIITPSHIIILGTDVDNILSILHKVFTRFSHNSLKFKPRKCSFFQKEVEFLGKLVSEKGVSIAPGKMDVLKSWPRPLNSKELQSFLGFMNYHRNHIRNFASVAECLYKLANEKSFNWLGEHKSAFRQLKEEAIMSPLLSHPTPQGTFVLDVDASNRHIGGALYQRQNDELVPISFGSYTLLPAQRKYCTTRKELLSLVRFCRTYRHYLLGRPFLVRTDHNSLVWLTRFKHIEGQLARWLEELSQYNMTIEHRKGCDHINADALSRMGDPFEFCDCYNAGANLGDLPCGGCPYCTRAHHQWSRFRDDVDDVVPLAIMDVQNVTVSPETVSPNWFDNYTPAQLRDFQIQDPEIGLVIIWLESEIEPSRRELLLTGPGTRALWSCRQCLLIENGILHYSWSDHPELGTMTCTVIPQALRQDILKGCHDSKTSGHLGIKKTLERVKSKYFWYGMTKDVELHVLGCKTCNKNKKGNVTLRAGQRLYHAGFPMERVHLDILGPFHISSQGNRYILVMVDQFTKWVELAAIPEQSAQRTVQAFVDRFVSTFGCPLEIHTDQGRNFESDLFQAFCKMLEITKTRTTPYRPCSNGQCEVFNRVILQMIRSFISKGLKDWDVCLPLIAMALHSMKNQATGFSANMMMLGRETLQPLDLMFGQLEFSSVEAVSWVKELSEKMSHVHRIARENLGQTQLRQKRDYDLRLHERHFHLGDPVYLRDSSTKVGVSTKLRPPWAGPYVVSQVEHPLYTIESGKRSWKVHHDRIKLCRDSDLPLWLRRRRHILLEIDMNILDSEQSQNDSVGEDVIPDNDDIDLDQTLPYMIPDELDDDIVSVELNSSDSEDEPQFKVSRGGRVIKKPARFL